MNVCSDFLLASSQEALLSVQPLSTGVVRSRAGTRARFMVRSRRGGTEERAALAHAVPGTERSRPGRTASNRQRKNEIKSAMMPFLSDGTQHGFCQRE